MEFATHSFLFNFSSKVVLCFNQIYTCNKIVILVCAYKFRKCNVVWICQTEIPKIMFPFVSLLTPSGFEQMTNYASSLFCIILGAAQQTANQELSFV